MRILCCLRVSDLSQDCGSIVLHASFDANPLPPAPSCPVNCLDPWLLFVLMIVFHSWAGDVMALVSAAVVILLAVISGLLC